MSVTADPLEEVIDSYRVSRNDISSSGRRGLKLSVNQEKNGFSDPPRRTVTGWSNPAQDNQSQRKTSDEFIYNNLLDGNIEEVWTANIPEHNSSGTVYIGQDVVYTGEVDGGGDLHIHCFDIADGTLVWHQNLGGTGSSPLNPLQRFISGVSQKNDDVFVPSGSERDLKRLSSIDGSEVWEIVEGDNDPFAPNISMIEDGGTEFMFTKYDFQRHVIKADLDDPNLNGENLGDFVCNRLINSLDDSNHPVAIALHSSGNVRVKFSQYDGEDSDYGTIHLSDCSIASNVHRLSSPSSGGLTSSDRIAYVAQSSAPPSMILADGNTEVVNLIQLPISNGNFWHLCEGESRIIFGTDITVVMTDMKSGGFSGDVNYGNIDSSDKEEFNISPDGIIAFGEFAFVTEGNTLHLIDMVGYEIMWSVPGYTDSNYVSCNGEGLFSLVDGTVYRLS